LSEKQGKPEPDPEAATVDESSEVEDRTPDAAQAAETTSAGEQGPAVPGADAASDPDSTADRSKSHRKARFPTLVRAFRSGRPVDGTIVEVIKGGYTVKLGKAHGFCPHSQIDLQREDNPERQLGQSYQFKIAQLRRGGEDIVLSRRALLEEDRADEAKAVRATLIEGTVMQGRVVGTAAFGAFVDLGAGVLGLAHISELSHRRIENVGDAVTVGESVRVRILKLKESGRVSLSIRRAEEDPWTDIEKRFEVGRVYPGTVQRVADFGVFVELAPGVEALAPASEFPPAPDGWKQGLELGTTHDWYVLSVDPKGRRLSVTLPGDAADAPAPLAEGAEFRGRVQRIERYGVFVWLGPGRVGLMPRVQTGAPESADLRRRFRIGEQLEGSIVEIADDGRKIRLRKKGVIARPEREVAPARPKMKKDQTPVEEPQPESFGTSLADKLRAALGENE
jgi:small subunit ribosomal protein S1